MRERRTGLMLAVLLCGCAAAGLAAPPPELPPKPPLEPTMTVPLPGDAPSAQDRPLPRVARDPGEHRGWPRGFATTPVRFIRLQYDGGDWDRNMGVGADYNLLLQFNKITGFGIAPATEAVKITALRQFPKNRVPPFVYITGSGGIKASATEVATLRRYCIEQKGLIFADCGGPGFDKAFRELMARCFPDLTWTDIANDDSIYRQPFAFATGAPPLWHHAGSRALGLKHNGRWIAFYHRGGLSDAWKTGHSGVSKFLAAQAYKLGINVIYYAFTPDAERAKAASVPAVRAAPAVRPMSNIEKALSAVSHERPKATALTLDAALDAAAVEPPAKPVPAAAPGPRAQSDRASPLSQTPDLE